MAARFEELKEKALSNPKSLYGFTLRMFRKSTVLNYYAILMVQVRELQRTLKTADGRDILDITYDMRRLIKAVREWGTTVPASRKNGVIKEMNQLSLDVPNWVLTSPRNNRHYFIWMYRLCEALNDAVDLMQGISVVSGDSAPDDVESGDSAPDDVEFGDSAPDDVASGDSAPADDVEFGNSAPDDVVSGDSAPDDVESGDSFATDNQETEKSAVKQEQEALDENKDHDEDCNILISFFSQ